LALVDWLAWSIWTATLGNPSSKVCFEVIAGICPNSRPQTLTVTGCNNDLHLNKSGICRKSYQEALLGKTKPRKDTETKTGVRSWPAENVASGFFDRQYRPRWSSANGSRIDALRVLAIVLMATRSHSRLFGDHSIDALDFGAPNFTTFLSSVGLLISAHQRSSASLA